MERALNEVRAAALQGDDPGEMLSRLLMAGRKLLEIAEGMAASLAGEHSRTASHAELSSPQHLEFLRYVAPEKEAERIYRARRLRERVFSDPKIFGEPAWDLLLDLYAADRSQRHISITSACIAANVPPTTALRWLLVLERGGYIERHDDKVDARRSFVRLTPRGREKMETFVFELANLAIYR